MYYYYYYSLNNKYFQLISSDTWYLETKKNMTMLSKTELKATCLSFQKIFIEHLLCARCF